jgi:hypothetical protein
LIGRRIRAKNPRQVSTGKTKARDTRGHDTHSLFNARSKASPEAARVGLASLMRPEGPLPVVPFADCRYAVARTMPQRFSRLNWPGGVMASPLLLLACRASRDPNRNASVSLFALAVNPYWAAAPLALACAQVVTRAFRFLTGNFSRKLFSLIHVPGGRITSRRASAHRPRSG